jgi:tight adherence protein B
MKRRLAAGFAVLVAVLVAAAASGATAPPPRLVEAGGASYPQRAYIMTLPVPKRLSNSDVSVTENGRAVSGLNVTQQGTAGNGTAIVLAIDASGSMTGTPIKDAMAAAQAFAEQAGPDEQIAIVSINNGVHVIQAFTTDPQKIKNALASPPKLAIGTKINDALDQSLKMIGATGVANGAIVLLSDGTDVGSKLTRAAVLKELAAGHTRVFSVGLVSKTFNRKGLEKLASTSHGEFVEAAGPSQLEPIFSALGQRLSREYLLTYTSVVNPSRKALVKVSVAGFRPARTAYTTPALHLVPAAPYKPSQVDKVLQSNYLAIAVVLIVSILLGYAVMHAFSSRPDPLVTRVGDFVSVQRTDATTPKAEREPRVRTGFLTRMTARRESNWSARFAETLELADIDMQPSHVVLLTALATIVMMLVLVLLIGPLGVLAGLCTPFLVRWFILRRVSNKRRTFGEQLPDNLEVLASALRAGHSLVSALTVVADDATEPSKTEFRRVLAEEQFGVQLEDAFKTTVERMNSVDLEQVALVARLQREMGSNSAEVLDRVIETIRSRMELRRLVRTLTAQGRLSRWILTLLPIVLAVLLTLISSSYMHPLFHTLGGQILLVMVAIMVALGSFVIGKIVDIKV